MTAVKRRFETREEEARKMELQEMCIGAEKLSAIGDAGDQHPGLLLDRRSVPPTSQKQQAGKATRDQEYATSMEERYGIREEGVF
jgi:hypothetical protein